MKDINKVILIGRLGADPVRRETKTGQFVTQFPVATSRRRRVEGGEEGQEPVYAEETQWHRVVVWGKAGESCAQYLKKGQPVFVEGFLRSRKYDDKEGVERVSFEVIADNVSFLGGAKAKAEAGPDEARIA